MRTRLKKGVVLFGTIGLISKNMEKARAPAPGLRPPLRVPFFYGWLVLALSFFTTLMGAAIRSAPAVFIHPLEAEFGWSRAAIASAISVNLLLYGMASPVSGWLLDRYGPRRVMTGCLGILIAGIGATTLMREYWQLVLLWGFVVGTGAGGTASVLSATVTNRWFVGRRGLALGILNSASSTGQLIFLPLLMAVIVASGWRTGSLLLAFAALLLLPLVVLFMRDDPAEVGLTPYGSREEGSALSGQSAAAADPEVVPLSKAFRTSTFWFLAASFFVCGGTANGLIGTHLIPHSIDHGIPEVVAAATVGVMGGLNFVGTLFSGWMVDRVDPRRLLSVVYALRGLSLFILPFVTDFSGLFVFGVIYGLDWFATVPPTIVLTSDTFGKRSVGRIYGWIFLSHQVGAAVMATVSGAIRVWLGDYQFAFLTGGVLALIASGLALKIPLRRPALVSPVPSRVANA